MAKLFERERLTKDPESLDAWMTGGLIAMSIGKDLIQHPVSKCPRVVQAEDASRRATPHLDGKRTPRWPEIARLPLTFIANRGQVDERVQYYVKGAAHSIWVLPTAVVFDVCVNRAGASGESARRVVFALRLLDSNPRAVFESEGLQQGTHNLFSNALVGARSISSRVVAPTFRQIVCRNVWEGIDFRLSANASDLEQEFVVRPGADPAQIRVAYEGIERLSLAPDGSLVISTGVGDLRESKPQLYQEGDGQRIEISGSFELHGEATYGFAIPAFEYGCELVIDPTLSWSRYVGGSFEDYCNAVATDAAGNVYLTGGTRSGDFPISANALQPAIASTFAAPDVFVMKLDPNGVIIYSTFLGGSEGDIGLGIAVDDAGNAYVTGSTKSPNFPTLNALQATPSANTVSAFVAKIDPTGSSLLYSTYLGGAGDTVGNDIAVDAAGHAYVVGQTNAADFPTANPLQPSLRGGPRGDAFVAKFAPGGNTLVYSTYLGGSGEDVANGVAVDAMGNAYVTGFTSSLDFPTTANPLQPRPGATGDPTDLKNPVQEAGSSAFVAKLDPLGSTLLYSTYFGREMHRGEDIAVDAVGNVFVVGSKALRLYPPPPASPPGAHWDLGGPAGFFIAKLDATGARIRYETDLGVRDEIGEAIASAVAVDATGRAYVTGRTASRNFPIVEPIQIDLGGSGNATDAFVFRLDPNGVLDFSSYFGGNGSLEIGTGIALGPANEIYIAGSTDSTDLRKVLQPALDRSNGFVAAIADTTPTIPTTVSVTRVLPNHAADKGNTSVVVYGSGFSDVATLSLTRVGEAPIVGRYTDVASGGSQMHTTLDLTGAAQATWDVVVRNPDGASAALPGGFAVEASRPPQISVNIIGSNQIRRGSPSTLTVLVENRWNRDALLVPLLISGIPRDAEVDLLVDIASHPAFPEGVRQVSPVIDDGRQKQIPLLIPVIPAGSNSVLSLAITPASLGQMDLVAGASVPMAQSEVGTDATGCALATTAFLLDMSGVLVSHGCYQEAEQVFVGWSMDLVEIGYQGFHAKVDWISIAQLQLGLAALTIVCVTGRQHPGAALITELATLLGSVVKAIEECYPSEHESEHPTRIVTSVDPNEKFGPQGSGEARYVCGEATMAYGISFENLAAATAPAQEVVITDRLDATNFDIDTFTLGDITFGNTRVRLRGDSRNFTTDVDLRPATDLLVRVEARLEPNTGLLTWRFRSLDPATGGTPADPMAGFLPPNRQPPEGQGTVWFTCRARPGLPSGTVIRNSASIVFDNNVPIATQEWINTIDSSPPKSRVEDLAPTQPVPWFTVKWSGTDEGSGILNYTIFVSENGGSFVIWLRNTKATAEQFRGKEGSVYAFYSLAIDAAGNVEQREPRADAMTRVKARLQTGIRTLRFEVYSDAAGEYRWRLVASNGRTVATSGEAFASKANAQRAADRVRQEAGFAQIVVSS